MIAAMKSVCASGKYEHLQAASEAEPETSPEPKLITDLKRLVREVLRGARPC